MVPKLLFFFTIIWFLDGADSIIRNNARNIVHQYKNSIMANRINKVSLTQKGYIQFLKYIDTVPPLTDYTFCIWMRSKNLTFSHPILSYSKHEEERLIRFWISPFGKSINLEILGHAVFDVPFDIVENHWYHICQSWSSYQASWSLYLNGKLRSNGYQPQLRGLIIEGEGDIVVGQEYTDFDKGLEDGIEGDVFGFNFVLSSTTPRASQPLTDNFLRKNYQLPMRKPEVYEKMIPLVRPNVVPDNTKRDEVGSDSVPKFAPKVPDVLGYFNTEPVSRNPKGLLDVFKTAFGLTDEPARVRVVYHPKPRFHNHLASRSSGPYDDSSAGRISNRKSTDRYRLPNEIEEIGKPLGLLLVELSFDCGFKKGAPLSGEGVLINWTRTPVRVFGGAILKSVAPFCT